MIQSASLPRESGYSDPPAMARTVTTHTARRAKRCVPEWPIRDTARPWWAHRRDGRCRSRRPCSWPGQPGESRNGASGGGFARSPRRRVSGSCGKWKWVTGPSSSARSCRPSCGSVAGGAELIDDAPRNAAPRRDLDLVGRGPGADGLGAVVEGGGRLRTGGSGAVLPAADLARGRNVAVQGCAQVIRVLIRQIDLVPAAVEGETDRFAGTVDDLGVIQIIDESDNRTLRHQCSLCRLLLRRYDEATSGHRRMLPRSEYCEEPSPDPSVVPTRPCRAGDAYCYHPQLLLLPDRHSSQAGRTSRRLRRRMGSCRVRFSA